jgi:hypothetical protein
VVVAAAHGSLAYAIFGRDDSSDLHQRHFVAGMNTEENPQLGVDKIAGFWLTGFRTKNQQEPKGGKNGNQSEALQS